MHWQNQNSKFLRGTGEEHWDKLKKFPKQHIEMWHRFSFSITAITITVTMITKLTLVIQIEIKITKQHIEMWHRFYSQSRI